MTKENNQELERADNLIGHNVSGLDSVKRNQGMRNEWKERLDLAFAASYDDASSKALVEWFQSEISLLKKGIEEQLPKTEDYLKFDPATEARRIYVDSFNKCLEKVKDVVRKAGCEKDD